MIAAASIIEVLAIGGYVVFNNKTPKPTEANNINLSHDLKAPEVNRATITLASGEKVFLDSAVNGTLAKQGNMNILKFADGRLAYNGNQQSNS